MGNVDVMRISFWCLLAVQRLNEHRVSLFKSSYCHLVSWKLLRVLKSLQIRHWLMSCVDGSLFARFNLSVLTLVHGKDNGSMVIRGDFKPLGIDHHSK